MQCPSCRTKLKKIYSEGTHIEVCPQCSVSWFNKKQLIEYLENSTENRNEEVRNTHPPKISKPAKIDGFCPKCNKSLETYSLSSTAKIGFCPECGGLSVGIDELSHLEYYFCQDYWHRISSDLTPRKSRHREIFTEGSVIKAVLGLVEDENPNKVFPWITLGLIIINVLMFILLILDTEGMRELLLVPEKLLKNPAENWTALITCMFLHGGFFHLAGNMYFLWIFGDNVEDIVGKIKYILLYLFFGIISGLIYSLVSPDPEIPTLGASGAISGIMGAYLYLFPKARINVFTFFLFRGIKINLPAWFYLGIWFVFQQLIGISLDLPGVAWAAHLAGFVLGFLCLLILKKTDSL